MSSTTEEEMAKKIALLEKLLAKEVIKNEVLQEEVDDLRRERDRTSQSPPRRESNEMLLSQQLRHCHEELLKKSAELAMLKDMQDQLLTKQHEILRDHFEEVAELKRRLERYESTTTSPLARVTDEDDAVSVEDYCQDTIIIAREESPLCPLFLLHKGVDGAVRCLWDNQFAECEKKLAKGARISPRYCLEYAITKLVETAMFASYETRETALEYFSEAEALALQVRSGPAVLVDGGTTTVDEIWHMECDVITADALFFKAVLQMRMNSYLKGAVNLRKSWGLYASLLQRLSIGGVPHELEMTIKFGCGMFYTYLTLVPSNLMTVLKAIGFISDRNLGEQFLSEVAQSGTSIRAPFAALGLIAYYVFLPPLVGDTEEALMAKANALFEIVLPAFPNNSYFYGLRNLYYRRRGDSASAIAAIQKAISNAIPSTPTKTAPILFLHMLGDTYFMDLQVGKARDIFTEIHGQLSQSPPSTFAFAGQAGLMLAACHMWLGDEKKCLEEVRRVSKSSNAKTAMEDANSPKVAAMVLGDLRHVHVLGWFLLYLNRDVSHLHRDRIREMSTLLDTAVHRQNVILLSPEVKALYLLLKGVMTQSKSLLDEAMNLDSRLPAESVLIPYMAYELGATEGRAGNEKRAKELFEKACKSKGEALQHELLAVRPVMALRHLSQCEK